MAQHTRLLTIALLSGIAFAPSCKNDKAQESATEKSAKTTAAAIIDAAVSASSSEDVSCEEACRHLLDLTAAAFEDEAEALPKDVADKLRSHAQGSAGKDLQTCVTRCDEGEMRPECVVAMESIYELKGCAPTRKKRSPEDALVAMERACRGFSAAHKAKQSCENLASAVEEVAAAYRDVSGDAEAPRAERCVDLIMKVHGEGCGKTASYQEAVDTLMRAATQ